MEVSKNSTCNKEKRKKIVGSGIGGIAGVLILGGAFAVATLVRNKSSKKRSDTNNPKIPTTTAQKLKSSNGSDNSICSNVSDGDTGSEGLRSLLQTPSMESQHGCRSSIEHDASRITSTQIDSYPEPDSVETSVMEDRTTIEVNVKKKISTCGDHSGLLSREAVAVIGEDDLPETTHVDGILSMPLKREIECDHDDLFLYSFRSSTEHDVSSIMSTQKECNTKPEIVDTPIMAERSATEVPASRDQNSELGNSEVESIPTFDIIHIIKDGDSLVSSEGMSSLNTNQGLLTYQSIKEEDHSDSPSREVVSMNGENDLQENPPMPLKEETEDDHDGNFIYSGRSSIEDDESRMTTTQTNCNIEPNTVGIHIMGERSAIEFHVDKKTFNSECIESASEKLEMEAFHMIKDGVRFTGSEGIIKSFDIDQCLLLNDSVDMENHSELPSRVDVTIIVGDVLFEENPFMPRKGEVEYDDDNEDDMEESSEGTDESSIESNSDAIWSVECKEEELQLLKVKIERKFKLQDRRSTKKLEKKSKFN